MGDGIIYEVEKNVPYPRKGAWRFIAAEMTPGDSVLVADESEATALTHAITTYWNKQNASWANDVTRRKAQSIKRKQENGTYRVWRVT